MKTIHVNASKSYDILIERGILDRAGEEIKTVCGAGEALIVSDDTVWDLYGETVLASMQKAGFDVTSFTFPHGEQSKNLSVYADILNARAARHLSRKGLVVALGGGVVGDMAGFAAATYRRGMDYIQLPTTLLAAVDSSVGGKTAINLRAGKNQLGCFHQPAAVICDTDTFSTLPEREVRSGSAEIIKYGVIGDEGFFESLGAEPISARYEEVVERCVSMKRDFVARDEFDRGDRRYLNFGHTIGHAAERCSGYTLPHGYAVAMGMAAISRAAESFGISEKGTAERIEKMLKRYGLPTEIDFARDDMLDAMLSDKKSDGSSVALIVPERIGRCRIENAGAAELCEWLKAGGIK